MGLGIKNPVVTLGEMGAVFFDGNKNVHAKAFDVHPVDTTAAGDTFAGALAFMIVNGKPLAEAVEFAQAAAAISVTGSGAQNSIPNYNEVVDFLGARP